MFKNKKFGRYAIIFMLLGIVFNFMYSGLQNDQINIIQGFSAWTNAQTLIPLTIGNFVCIALTFVYGTLFIKYGVKKTLIPCMALSALGCVGIALAGGLAAQAGNGILASGEVAVGNYALYSVSLFIVRCTCMCFQMAGFQLAASWFIKYRGQFLGIITLGSPLFSVVGTSVMTSFISTNLGGDYRPFYIGIAVVIVIIIIAVAAFVKDFPEDAGLYPDGADSKPAAEAADEEKMTVGQVLSEARAWWLIISYGAFQVIINACMASMVVWFTHLCVTNVDAVSNGPLGGMFMGMGGLEGAGAMALFVGQAVKWLSVGAILGIPMSYVFGLISDKIGAVKTSFILGITEFIPIIGLMVQKSAVAETGSCNVPMLILWGFGVACMTGGVPTMHPAITSYVYGRRQYQSANRVIMSIQLIPCAVTAMVMAALINGSNDMMAWYLCIVITAIGILACIPLLKVKSGDEA